MPSPVRVMLGATLLLWAGGCPSSTTGPCSCPRPPKAQGMLSPGGWGGVGTSGGAEPCWPSLLPGRVSCEVWGLLAPPERLQQQNVLKASGALKAPPDKGRAAA